MRLQNRPRLRGVGYDDLLRDRRPSRSAERPIQLARMTGLAAVLRSRHRVWKEETS